MAPRTLRGLISDTEKGNVSLTRNGGGEERTVKDDNSRNKAYTEASNEPASYDDTKTVSVAYLDNDTDNVDEATSDDSGTTTIPLCQVTGNECTKEGTGGEDGNDERIVRTGE